MNRSVPHPGSGGSAAVADQSQPYPVGFVLLPDFSMIAFAAALEPLRTANRISRRRLYEWVLIAPEGNSMAASNGIEISTAYNIDTMPTLPMVLLVGGAGNEHYFNAAVSSWLRRIARTDTTLGAISAAPYALARAGLLHGRRCTLHWERAKHFADEFPDCLVTQELFVADGRIVTCAGGIAAFDMMFGLIAGQHGETLARAVSDTCICPGIRDGSASQRMATAARLGSANRHLVSLVEQMERNIENPLSLSELARFVDLSPRQVGRLFHQHFNTSPHQYYLRLRLARAWHLLGQSDLSVLDIAMACGFSSSSHFSQTFLSQFGLTPREARLRERTGKVRSSIGPFP